MSQTGDLMEIKEERIIEKYAQAESLLNGLDHTPRLAKKADVSSTNKREKFA